MNEERIRELWRQAVVYYTKAREEFERGEYEKACEAAWGAVNLATRALCLKFLGRESPPTREIKCDEVVYQAHVPPVSEFVQQALIKAGIPEPEAERLANFYLLVREGLHGRAFYGADYESQTHRSLFERVPEYLKTVAGLLGMGPVSWGVEHE
jgi:HEPN domain-containing protein